MGTLPVGGVGRRFGPNKSRFRVPAGVAETAAAAAQRNKSFWTRPRLVGASLRCRRQVHGGGTPCVELLCRSHSSEAIDLGFCRGVVDVGTLLQGWRGDYGICGNEEDGSTSTFPWRCLSSTARYVPRPRGLGAWPRPMSFQRRHISFLGTSVYFGSLQSLCAMESSRFWERWRLDVLAPGGVRRRRIQVTAASTGALGLICNLFFIRVPVCD